MPGRNVPNGATQLTWLVCVKKLLEMAEVLKKSARARSFCCAWSMNSSHFCLAAWLDA